jgi:hypothetical protein
MARIMTHKWGDNYMGPQELEDRMWLIRRWLQQREHGQVEEEWLRTEAEGQTRLRELGLLAPLSTAQQQGQVDGQHYGQLNGQNEYEIEHLYRGQPQVDQNGQMATQQPNFHQYWQTQLGRHHHQQQYHLFEWNRHQPPDGESYVHLSAESSESSSLDTWDRFVLEPEDWDPDGDSDAQIFLDLHSLGGPVGGGHGPLNGDGNGGGGGHGNGNGHYPDGNGNDHMPNGGPNGA